MWTAPFGTLLDPIQGRLEGLGVVLLQTTDADAAPQHVNPSVVLMLRRECWPNIKSTPGQHLRIRRCGQVSLGSRDSAGKTTLWTHVSTSVPTFK